MLTTNIPPSGMNESEVTAVRNKDNPVMSVGKRLGQLMIKHWMRSFLCIRRRTMQDEMHNIVEDVRKDIELYMGCPHTMIRVTH
jgi:hypothetical protein